MTKEMSFEKIPEKVFNELHISKLILIEADVNIVSKLLYERDQIRYSLDFLNDFMKLEHDYSIHIENKYCIPHIIIVNNLSDEAINEFIRII